MLVVPLVRLRFSAQTRTARYGFQTNLKKSVLSRYPIAIIRCLAMTTAHLVAALKDELKSARMTYADLARKLGMSESSVKRMLARGDMPLSRIDAICAALKLDFAELARRIADAQPLLAELTLAQEKAVVADKKLMLVAICVLSQWTMEQITQHYRLTEAEAVKYLVQLDRIGIIELRPLNRYRL